MLTKCWLDSETTRATGVLRAHDDTPSAGTFDRRLDWSSVPFPERPTPFSPQATWCCGQRSTANVPLGYQHARRPRWMKTPFPAIPPILPRMARAGLFFHGLDGKAHGKIWDPHANVKLGDAKPFPGLRRKKKPSRPSIDKRRVTGDRKETRIFDLALDKQRPEFNAAPSKTVLPSNAAKLQVLIKGKRAGSSNADAELRRRKQRPTFEVATGGRWTTPASLRIYLPTNGPKAAVGQNQTN